jgi:hypothetical protein
LPAPEDLAERAIRYTADRAWNIAFHGGAPDEVCLGIEALSDDPAICAEIVAEVLAGKRRTPDPE